MFKFGFLLLRPRGSGYQRILRSLLVSISSLRSIWPLRAGLEGIAECSMQQLVAALGKSVPA